MANTLGGVNIDRIAEQSLDALTTVGIPLNAFTTDFSPEPSSREETITTRFATVPSTQDFSSTRARADVTTTARQITLNNYKGVKVGFSDTERTYTDQQLDEMFIVPAISAIVDGLISDTLALATEANFTVGNQSTVVDSAFVADNVADIAEALSVNKVPMSGRSMILKPTYYGNLSKDTPVQAAYAYGGSEVIRDHNIPRVHGFDVYEYNGTIPSNSESLEGFACGKQALCIAARGVVEPEQGTWYGEVRNITEPKTGLTIQVRKYYDESDGYQKVSWSVLYGVQLGIPNYGHLIASA